MVQKPHAPENKVTREFANEQTGQMTADSIQ